MANPDNSGLWLPRELSLGLETKRIAIQSDNQRRMKQLNPKIFNAVCAPSDSWQVSIERELVRCRHGYTLSFTEAERLDDLNIAYLQAMHTNFMRVKHEGKTAWVEFPDPRHSESP